MGESKAETVVDVPTQSVFRIGDHSVTLVPVKIKRFRQIIGIVSDAADRVGKHDTGTTGVKGILDIMLDQSTELIKLLFDEKLYPFMTTEFIEENMTVTMAREILEKAAEINRLYDIFPALKTVLKPKGDG